MNKILTLVALPLTFSTVVAFGTIQSSNAQETQSKFSRQTPQSILGQTPNDATITPSTTTAAAKLPANYGIVRSASGGTLDVRMLDGTSKQITVPESLMTSAGGLQRGSLVGFDTDASGNVTTLQPPEVDKTIDGTVSAIDGDQVTVVSSTGESMTTSIETATIARMGLVPGKGLTVTTYKNSWVTKVCCKETPAPVAPPPVVPTPGGAGDLPPAKTFPGTGLW